MAKIFTEKWTKPMNSHKEMRMTNEVGTGIPSADRRRPLGCGNY